MIRLLSSLLFASILLPLAQSDGNVKILQNLFLKYFEILVLEFNPKLYHKDAFHERTHMYSTIFQCEWYGTWPGCLPDECPSGTVEVGRMADGRSAVKGFGLSVAVVFRWCQLLLLLLLCCYICCVIVLLSSVTGFGWLVSRCCSVFDR